MGFGKKLDGMPLSDLTQLLRANYERYALKNKILVDENFLILKVFEEVGELARAILTRKSQHPKGSGEIDEEACDALCQMLIYISYLDIDIGPTLNSKWLKDLQEL